MVFNFLKKTKKENILPLDKPQNAIPDMNIPIILFTVLYIPDT
jgi:hypothetical protein